ncbi:MAG: amidase [Candidatus Krumholzibacteria bacterium]|nr:amidase [Candidatus Krumholzibacteria bacterium]
MKRRVWAAALVAAAALAGYGLGASEDTREITSAMIEAAEDLIDIRFTSAERDSMRDDLADYREAYAKMRSVPLNNAVAPALVFDPRPRGFALSGEDGALALGAARETAVPEDLEDLAFYSVRDLAELVRTRKVTSTQLTRMYLDRLKAHGPTLECVITLTEDLATAQARRADAEIAAGEYRGPLHGIPYGAKDLLAVPGYRTTWGAAPYKEQVIDDAATVVRRLEEAGAVLVAKLTLGALAWGDVWYGGTTRNPWNPEQGSSGSSAGPASATAAGLVAFAIGTETWGSIVSPSARCGTTGLRPTFGRVSRAGAMALSWSMDKIGPICRTVEDCAIVFDAIRGADGRDASVIDAPFAYDGRAGIAGMRIGYVAAAFDEEYPNRDFDRATLETLEALGAVLVPVTLPDLPVEALPLILTVEAAAAFDELTRSGRDDLLVRQIKNAWPNVLRGARLVPAVEYVQANRIRALLIEAMADLDVDVYVCPSFGGDNLLLTNLTGHPCVVLPNGFTEEGTPVSVTFMGRLFAEGRLLEVASAYQRATAFHTRHPGAFR